MSDIDQLLRSEARDLMRHKAAGGSDEYLRKRAQVVDRMYGPGSRDQIRELMKTIKDDDANHIAMAAECE